MNLLVLKKDNKYLKISDNIVEFTTVEKASVFPISKVEEILIMRNKLKKKYGKIELYKMKITETLFTRDEI